MFSWLEYPDKATRDAANKKMMNDPRMKEMGDNMPFDGQRMIFGGFTPINDSGKASKPGYIDGCVIARARRQQGRVSRDGGQDTPRSSRNMARRARSTPGATTCRTARSPTTRAR